MFRATFKRVKGSKLDLKDWVFTPEEDLRSKKILDKFVRELVEDRINVIFGNNGLVVDCYWSVSAGGHLCIAGDVRVPDIDVLAEFVIPMREMIIDMGWDGWQAEKVGLVKFLASVQGLQKQLQTLEADIRSRIPQQSA